MPGPECGRHLRCRMAAHKSGRYNVGVHHPHSNTCLNFLYISSLSSGLGPLTLGKSLIVSKGLQASITARELKPPEPSGGPMGSSLVRMLRVMIWIEVSGLERVDRKSTRLNSSHVVISYAVFCLKKKTKRTACEVTDHMPA